MTNPAKDRCLELDAFRGLAALMVVIFHLTMNWPASRHGFYLGITGVDLFFIISGFVILMSLNRVKRSADFVISRVSRLYPTYWMAVTFTFFLMMIQALKNQEPFGRGDWVGYIGNMTMFQYYLNIADLDGPYWTMIVEMLFYILMLFLFHFKLLKWLVPIGASLCGLSVIVAFGLGRGPTLELVLKGFPLLQFLPLFLSGAIFYLIFTEKNRLWSRYALVLFFLTCQIAVYHFYDRADYFLNHIEHILILLAYYAAFCLFVNGKLKFIVTSTTLFLGKISYALYLTHQFLAVELLIPALTSKLRINYWVAAFGIALPVVISIATVATFCVEAPLAKRMQALLRRIAGRSSVDAQTGYFTR